MMMEWITWSLTLLTLLVCVTLLLIKYSTRNFGYWKKRGVYNPKPIPVFGNVAEIFFLKKYLGDLIGELYSCTDEPYFGIFVFDEPFLVVKSPELVQRVLKNDSQYFTDRCARAPKHDKIMSNYMLFQKSTQWKETRSKVSPVFSTAKLKGLFPLVNKESEGLVHYLRINSGVTDVKEACSKYAMNVIATCAFGINPNCFRNEHSSFRKVGSSMFKFSYRNAAAQLGYFLKPDLVDFLRLDFVNRKALEDFCDEVSKIMEEREMSDGKMNGASGTDRIFGLALQFFAAGFETTSHTVAFTLHELCLQPQLQINLRREILKIISEDGGLTYEGVQRMKYLDMCIFETLRKYPNLAFFDRLCNADYQLPGTDLVIEKGTKVFIPVVGLHLDEKYFPEPHIYNPDRFLDKNVNENGIVFSPFGAGPRHCIGERFGMMGTKLALINILSEFRVVRCQETIDPIEFEPRSFITQSRLGLPMKLESIR
ncbi:Cytochrome P450 6k1 [Gonioctena quinquepunctata]|nr:Cytochrome P450 6k1 [Gonioctena quinquepunctata]